VSLKITPIVIIGAVLIIIFGMLFFPYFEYFFYIQYLKLNASLTEGQALDYDYINPSLAMILAGIVMMTIAINLYKIEKMET